MAKIEKKKVTPKKITMGGTGKKEKVSDEEVEKDVDTDVEEEDEEEQEESDNDSSDDDGSESEPAPKLKSKAQVEDELESGEDKDEDYLQQFQYKKVNNIPTIGGPLTNPDAGSKAEKMKAHLLSQKRISVLVPLDPGSDAKVPYSVTLNGYRLDIPVNTYIELPEQVVELIRQSNNQTVAALNQFRTDGNKGKQDAGL